MWHAAFERLTQAGAWDEALKLIARYGQGEHRQALVFSLFAKSPEPLDAMLARMRGGEFSDSDRAILLRGLARNIAGPDGMSKVNALLAAKPKLALSEAEAVSMAYARQALASGDVTTARKWAEQVSTPKFKTKIDGEIAAGAVGK
ncbi:hypothetical protein [Haloferula sp. BvORR071]|uniref:hypothetical protein n=1 Tax=Haloferula sp. BvORR071 TaxID=1396141 RepID=UPI000551BEEB|nr:hypothetical protein [Haloferula sp. BvORR071]